MSAQIDKDSLTNPQHVLCMESLSELMQKFQGLQGVCIIEDPVSGQAFITGTVSETAAQVMLYAYSRVTRGIDNELN